MAGSAVILAYFVAWSVYNRAYLVKDIPVDKLTHINYAFANIDSDGRIALGDPWADKDKNYEGDTWDQPVRGNFNQLIKLKEKNPHLRTLISVGGWTWSGKFSDVALNDESRSKFAASCVEFIQKYGFDGVDLDWEYPVSGGLPANTRRPEDKDNYVLLLKELRQQLDAVSDKKYLLTVAVGAGTERIANTDLPGMAEYLDWFNVMTYDFHGGWEALTDHNAPLYKNDEDTTSDDAPSYIKSKFNCDAAIQAHLATGISSQKILMGLPLYGRGWQGVKDTERNGFSQSASSQLPTGTWENGVFDYDHLKKSYIPSYTRYWDDQSKVPFIFNPSTGIWISYDDVESVTLKNDYIKQNQLGGAFFWELSSDRQAELVGATYDALNNDDSSATTKRPSSTSHPKSKVRPWGAKVQYKVGQRVTWEGKTYRCIKKHKSKAKLKPNLAHKYWKVEAVTEGTTRRSITKSYSTTKKNKPTKRPKTTKKPKPTRRPKTTTPPDEDNGSDGEGNGSNENDNGSDGEGNGSDENDNGSDGEGNDSNGEDNGSEWNPNKSYSVGDTVMYERKKYRCILAHKALSDWTPSTLPALWQPV